MSEKQLVVKSENNQIYNPNSLKEVGKYVKELKSKHEKTSKKLDNYLEDNSKNEREAVADALHKLSLKMNSLKESDYYKEMQDKLEKYEEKLEITMTKVFIAYKKGIKMIFKQYPSVEERKQKLLDYHQALEDAFLTEDEKEIMSTIKNQIKSIPHRIVDIY